eukprot:5669245-Pyramimonas_sp.AAC.1
MNLGTSAQMWTNNVDHFNLSSGFTMTIWVKGAFVNYGSEPQHGDVVYSVGRRGGDTKNYPLSCDGTSGACGSGAQKYNTNDGTWHFFAMINGVLVQHGNELLVGSPYNYSTIDFSQSDGTQLQHNFAGHCHNWGRPLTTAMCRGDGSPGMRVARFETLQIDDFRLYAQVLTISQIAQVKSGGVVSS